MKIPSKQEVAELVRKTGESTRKCYYWLLHDLNKNNPPTQPSLFPQGVIEDTPKQKSKKAK